MAVHTCNRIGDCVWCLIINATCLNFIADRVGGEINTSTIVVSLAVAIVTVWGPIHSDLGLVEMVCVNGMFIL